MAHNLHTKIICSSRELNIPTVLDSVSGRLFVYGKVCQPLFFKKDKQYFFYRMIMILMR